VQEVIWARLIYKKTNKKNQRQDHTIKQYFHHSKNASTHSAYLLCLLQINISNKRKKGPSVILNTHPPQKKKKKKKEKKRKKVKNLQMIKRPHPFMISSEIQIRSKPDAAVIKMMTKVATIEPWSNAFCKLPVREKCWKAKYPAINKETIAPA
jgi:hypothetical protein